MFKIGWRHLQKTPLSKYLRFCFRDFDKFKTKMIVRFWVTLIYHYISTHLGTKWLKNNHLVSFTIIQYVNWLSFCYVTISILKWKMFFTGKKLLRHYTHAEIAVVSEQWLKCKLILSILLLESHKTSSFCFPRWYLISRQYLPQFRRECPAAKRRESYSGRRWQSCSALSVRWPWPTFQSLNQTRCLSHPKTWIDFKDIFKLWFTQILYSIFL